MNSSPKTVAATALLLPVVLLVTLLLLVVGGAQRPVSCADPVTGHAPGVAGPTGQTVAGLSERQLQLARQGVAIGLQRGMPEAVIIAELAAQITESSLRNLANPNVPESLNYPNDGIGTDHDSVGPHQLRFSLLGQPGIAVLMDPVYQINWFYDKAEALGAAAGALTPAELAQEIERSAPNAYGRHIELARQLYAMFADLDPGSMPRTPPGAPASGCPTGNTPSGQLPPTSDFGTAVIEAASRWIGTPYVWGGGDVHGPTGGGFDCSGLTLYAIYHASQGRIRLPHYTQAQQDHPTAEVVPFAARSPGDLIFFTTPGAADSHHVGIYAGRDEQGRDLLLHAPTSGQTVTIGFLSDFDGERMDVRRYPKPTPDGRSDPRA
ncbi:C40 family peptidase [Nocardia cyriacigeorgica]|uniref:Peptidoglycan endopeptidase RipA n=1 Tax=Nocardia cyriacigeorgica TaxID=135487 RepID=A0A4U8VS73_9NOCA|nr:C40 family peptidase [Nocardia cyriacigeorgica]VFA96271.1 Peptidoglycan endopeptidase RipA precursor [Nocardia cyriacigeorgica]